eukprot:TRINITY_DN2714_c0_g1_i2.p1 TRINITY_DN2714_c0_g1~~TRINITY_DN2714_c0_g1_i2.p1  ORF type:complete len:210 (+),score=59.74 TRINITY_DN2714_c0_g1_i2:37-630(+)
MEETLDLGFEDGIEVVGLPQILPSESIGITTEVPPDEKKRKARQERFNNNGEPNVGDERKTNEEDKKKLRESRFGRKVSEEGDNLKPERSKKFGTESDLTVKAKREERLKRFNQDIEKREKRGERFNTLPTNPQHAAREQRFKSITLKASSEVAAAAAVAAAVSVEETTRARRAAGRGGIRKRKRFTGKFKGRNRMF